MSNKTKNETAAEIVAENVQAIAEATAAGESSAEEVAKAAADVGAVLAKSGKEKQAKSKAAPSKDKEATGALRAIGLAACQRHGLKCVWVTADGQCFDQESNARSHGKNLGNHESLKVEV